LPAQRNQQCEGDDELERRAEPQPVPNVRAAPAEEERQQAYCQGEDGGLPEMIRQLFDHFALRFLSFSAFRSRSRFLIVFSSSRTSSIVSFPYSASCAIIGCARPPKKLRISSRSRCRATSRATIGSKMSALPIFRTRATAFFFSNRYTVV